MALVALNKTDHGNNITEIIIELDKAKILLEQTQTERESLQTIVDTLQRKLIEKGNESNLEGLNSHALERKVM